jgi:hypothetical protein
MVISGTDKIVISSTDGYIRSRWSYPVQMVISGTGNYYLYRIWLSLLDMTICTRYSHLPHSVTIDQLYQIWLSVPDMTIRWSIVTECGRWSFLVQMVISSTDSHIRYRWSYPIQIVISSTDSHIWYSSYYWPSIADMTICTGYDHLPCMTICTRYDHLYRIWLSVPDMTICTRYDHLPHSVTIDHLYRIWLSVPDMTICTGYDHL